MSAAVLDRLLARDIVFVTGKGGVGKTTVATALATAAAARGRRTIVAEVAARADAGRRLGPGVLGVFEERAVAPGRHHLTGDPFWMSPARVPRGPIPANTAEVC